jgi:hypothetical protein
MYTVEMPSCGVLFLASSLEVSTRVQAILRFSLSNLSGCSVAVTDVRRIMKFTVENSTNSLIIYYISFRTITFPCTLPYSFPVPQIIE